MNFFLKRIFSLSVYGNITFPLLFQALYDRIYLKIKGFKFDVHLTDHCNLNCKGCSHFSPVAEESFTDITIFEKDMARIAQLFNKKKVFRILLLGGEPLLHPNFLEFIKITSSLFPFTKKEFVSNGILLLRQNEDFWETLKKTETMLYITNYPISLNYIEIKNKANYYGTPLYIEPEVKTFKKYIYDFSGSQNKFINYFFCGDARRCTQLHNGKIYACHQIAYAHHLNKFFGTHLEITEKDYIDIYQIDSYKDILNYLSRPLPFCKYCNLKKRKFNEKWGYSKKAFNEWSI